MTEAEAIALAEKREKHKPKSMTAKHWVAKHDSVKGWHAALVDNDAVVERAKADAAIAKARQAILSGDLNGYVEAASEHMMASLMKVNLDPPEKR